MWVICGVFVTAVVWLYACRRMIAWSACRMVVCLVCRSAVQHAFLCRNALRQGWCHMCAVLPAGGKHSSHSGCYFDADRDVAPAPEPAVLLASGCRACCCSTVGFASASPLAQLSSCRACRCISVILWCAFIPGVLCFYSAAIGHHVDTFRHEHDTCSQHVLPWMHGHACMYIHIDAAHTAYMLPCVMGQTSLWRPRPPQVA